MSLQLQNVGFLLHHCSKIKAFQYGQSLHAFFIKKSPQSDVYISNNLLNLYAKCKDMSSAYEVFDQMPQRNLVSWSAVISGYYQAGNYPMAIKLFSVMDLPANEFVYASSISACAALSALSYGKQIHAECVKCGYDSISFVTNSLISMYMNCGVCGDGIGVFTSAWESISIVSYNALISGFVKNMELERGLEVFKIMLQRGAVPNQFTLAEVLGICADVKNYSGGKEIHCMAVKFGLDTVAFVGNVILTMYSKCDCIEEAENAFRGIGDNDVFSWNTIISACSACGDYLKGLKYFQEMMDDGMSASLDDFTFASALASCSGIASIHHGKQIHAYMIRTRLKLDIGAGNALVNMYAKCGSVGCAITVFDCMKQHNLVSWNTIIAALGNHGLGKRALYMFEQMKELGIKPDSVTFIGLLTSCNHTGLLDEGEIYYNTMNDIYGIYPKIEHLSVLIDLLGKAGRLNKAREYVEKSPCGNDSIVLGSLLSACRLHGNVSVAEWVASRLMELQPMTSSPYVLLSNLYASTGKWDEVADARKMLKGSGIKKEPGYSLVVVRGVAQKFTVGDLLRSSMQEVKDILDTLNWEVAEISS